MLQQSWGCVLSKLAETSMSYTLDDETRNGMGRPTFILASTNPNTAYWHVPLMGLRASEYLRQPVVRRSALWNLGRLTGTFLRCCPA
jgi:hypothetical protein